MTSDILSNITERDKILRKYNKNREHKELYIEYRKLRNKVQRDVKNVKANFFMDKIEENKITLKTVAGLEGPGM